MASGDIIQGSGDVAALRVVYQRAAELVHWSMTAAQPALGGGLIVTVTARVKSVDQFWISQSPVDLGLYMGSVWWIWEKVVIGGDFIERGTVTIKAVGKPEARSRF